MAGAAFLGVEMVVARGAGYDLAVFGHAQAFRVGFVRFHGFCV